MKYLQTKNPPINNWVRYIDLLEDDKNIYLLMEYGGIPLFNHVKTMHELIKCGRLSVGEWTNHVRILFKQMCYYVNWLHGCGFTHSDISLENSMNTSECFCS